MRMNDANAVKLLRDICADSANVILTVHASQRMRQRNITLTQVIACLTKGIVHEPVALDQHGHWKLTMERRAGGRQIQVAAAIDLPTRAIVITVF